MPATFLTEEARCDQAKAPSLRAVAAGDWEIDYFFSQLIMLRSSADLLDGQLGFHAALCQEVDLAAAVGVHLGQNSEARVPSWISVGTFFISLRVSAVIRRLPVR